MLNVTLSSPTAIDISHFPTSILALQVARKGRPRMIGILLSSLMSMMTKSTGIQKSPTLTGASIKTPSGRRIDRSANYRVILVGESSPKPSFWKAVLGMRVTLAPESHNARLNMIFPTSQGIEKLPGSLSFCGSSLWIMALYSMSRGTVAHFCNFLRLERISFRNLQYEGMLVIASTKEMEMFKSLSLSRNFSNCFSSPAFSIL